MALRLEGKNTLVTGASSGIGRAIAIRFAREGANVAINYRNDHDQADAESVRQQASAANQSSKVIIARADVTSENEIKAMFQKAIETLGSLDVLVNNAGIQKACPPDQLEAADFDKVLAVNLRGPFLCAREALRH